ncbi:glycosyltransferase family 2 protein [Spirosoma luteolum]
MKPSFSIITPCFNSERTIAQTIESVLAQSYEPVEYILVDGQSTDTTLAIIERYSAVTNGRIRYLSEPDTGIYNAMNKGIQLATGDLIGIINSDDWYEPDALATVAAAYEQHGDAVYYGMLRLIVDDREFSVLTTHHDFLGQRMIQHPTCFVPRTFYNQFGGFDEQYRFAADYELMLRLKTRQVPFQQLYHLLANFREGGASINPASQLESFAIKKRYNFLTPQAYYKAVVRRNLSAFMQRLRA